MKKIIKIVVLILAIIALIIGIYFLVNKRDNVNKTDENKEIYSTTYYFELGSRSVKVYENGDVYDDLEIENPNHKVNYKYVKTLSKKQLSSLKEKINKNLNKNEIDNFLIQEIYGVEQFGNAGQY